MICGVRAFAPLDVTGCLARKLRLIDITLAFSAGGAVGTSIGLELCSGFLCPSLSLFSVRRLVPLEDQPTWMPLEGLCGNVPPAP